MNDDARENDPGVIVWGYQPHFRVQVAMMAKRLFPMLRPDLVPAVFLAGIPTEPEFGSDEVMLDPAKVVYSPSLLVPVPGIARKIHEDDQRRNARHSHPLAHSRYQAGVWMDAVTEAVKQCLGKYDDELQLKTLVSLPVERDSYYVHIVLQLPLSAYDAAPRLASSTVDDGVSVAASLLEATIDEFFSLCWLYLNLPDAGAYRPLANRSVEDVLKAAGRQLMYRPSELVPITEGRTELFASVDMVSSLNYEGKTCRGSVVLSRRNHSAISTAFAFRHPVPMSNARAVRKLLEITSANMHLLSDTNVVYGVGSIANEYDPFAEDIYVVAFPSPHSWRLEHADTVLMEVTRGIPSLPAPRLDRAKLRDTIERVFGADGNLDVDSILKIADAATDQAKGTTVVVAGDAQTESERLSGQSFAIEPVKPTPDLLNRISSIDGAVMLDTCAVCHGIGVILDGTATTGGDPSRGARFNSAVRYIGNPPYARVALVVSEDGMINIVPDLMPRISASLIPNLIAELEEIESLNVVPRRRYHQAMENLRHLRFYLTESDCDRVNQLWHSIDARIVLGEDTPLKRVYEDFRPQGMVDDSYFVDE